MNVEDNKKDTLWNELLKNLIKEGIQKFSRSTRLRLLLSSIEYHKLGSVWLSIYSLMVIPEMKPSIQEQFAATRAILNIEKDMKDNDLRMIESTGVDITMIFQFQNKFNIFQETIEKSVSFQVDFWRELLDDNPEIHKLLSLGSILTKKYGEIEKQFEGISNMGVSNIKVLELYGAFLKDVVHNDAEAKRVLEKIEFMNKSEFSNKQGPNKEEKKTGNQTIGTDNCIVIVSGNKGNIGEIISVSNEIMNFFGYKAREVIGQNIELLMPKYYAEKHYAFMTKYFATGVDRVMNKQRVVFSLTKKSYVKHMNLNLKILPNLRDGIQIIGVFSQVSGEDIGRSIVENILDIHLNYLLFNQKTGVILGVSESCYGSFGLKSSLFKITSTNSPNLEMLAPDLLDPEKQKQLVNKGLEIIFNSSELQDNYYFMGYDDDDENYSVEGGEARKKNSDGSFYSSNNDERNFLNRFRSAKVKAWITNVEKYGEDNICCVRMLESRDDDAGYMHKEIFEEVKGPLMEEIEIEDELEGDGKEDEGSKDEARKIKDMKAVIHEKKSPKNIKGFKRITLIFFLLIIIIEIASIYIKSDAITNIQKFFVFLEALYMRNIMVTDIRFYSRKLELIASNILTDEGGAIWDSTRIRISELTSDLEVNQLTCSDAKNFYEDSTGNTKSFVYPMFFRLKQNKNLTVDTVYQDAIYQYISSATVLVNSPAEELNRENEDISSNEDSNLNGARSQFHRINDNAFDSLLSGGEDIVQTIQSFIVDRVNKYQIYSLILRAAFLLISVFCLLWMMRYVFLVMNTSKGVMALFAVIKKSQIQQLTDQCNNYINTYLSDYIAAANIEEPASEESENLEKHSQDSKRKQDYFEDSASEEVGLSSRQDDNLDLPLEDPRRVINTEYDNMSLGAEGAKLNTIRQVGKGKNSANSARNPVKQEPPEAKTNIHPKQTTESKIAESNVLAVKNDTQINSTNAKKKANKKAESKVKEKGRGVDKKKNLLNGSKTVEKDEKVQQQAEEEEEQINNRIQKMKYSKDSNKKLVVVCFGISLAVIIFITLFTGFLHYYYLSSSKTIVSLLGVIGSAGKDVKLVYNIMYESLSIESKTITVGSNIYINWKMWTFMQSTLI